jgi:proteasome lid subunit RPN8/RPN11
MGPYLHIEHCIRGDSAKGRSTNVTFTAETWQHIQETMDRSYPDKKIVGWYHTHPGFGIFLSDMDVFICDNFFNLPWQVAFVYDPLGGDEGNFVWRAGKPKRERMLIEDDVTPLAANIPLISAAAAASGNAPVAGNDMTNDKIIELLSRVRQLERRQKLLIAAVAFLTAFFTMWAYELTPVPQPVKPATQPAASSTPKSTPLPPITVPPTLILPGPTTQQML